MSSTLYAWYTDDGIHVMNLYQIAHEMEVREKLEQNRGGGSISLRDKWDSYERNKYSASAFKVIHKLLKDGEYIVRYDINKADSSWVDNNADYAQAMYEYLRENKLPIEHKMCEKLRECSRRLYILYKEHIMLHDILGNVGEL